MTLRLARTLGVAALALAMGTGCVVAPEADADWRDAGEETPEDRMLFARARRVEARDASQNARVAAGIGAALTAYAGVVHLQSGSWGRDSRGDTAHMKDRVGVVALSGLLLTSIAVVFGGYHDTIFDQWGEIGRLEAEATAAGESDVRGWGDDPVPAARPAGTRLYLEHGRAVPALAAGVEIVRVSGPTDSALRDLADAVGAIQLPVLELPGQAGPVYVVGSDAVAKSLASRSVRR